MQTYTIIRNDGNQVTYCGLVLKNGYNFIKYRLVIPQLPSDLHLCYHPTDGSYGDRIVIKEQYKRKFTLQEAIEFIESLY